MDRKNIEIKARRSPGRDYAPLAQELGAVFMGEIPQKDTYFKVRSGRLKIRDFPQEQRSELISYQRADEAVARESHFIIQPLADPEMCFLQLQNTLGVDSVVSKLRSLFVWKNVRIHLDRVENLGDFIELEAAVDKNHDAATCFQVVNFLMNHFGIQKQDIEERSYRELLMPKPRAVTINTLRLRLEKVDSADSALFTQWLKSLHPDSVREPALYDEFARARFFERLFRSWELGSPTTFLKATDPQSGAIVGMAELHVESVYDNIGRIIHVLIPKSEHRAQGLGSEFIQGILEYAFYHLDLRRLSATVPEDRESALQAFLHAGFHREGISTDYFQGSEPNKYINGVHLAALKKLVPLA